jgi:hypothetical protein
VVEGVLHRKPHLPAARLSLAHQPGLDLGRKGVVLLLERDLRAAGAVLDPDQVVLPRLADGQDRGAHAAVPAQRRQQAIGGARGIEIAAQVEIGAHRPRHLDGALANGRLDRLGRALGAQGRGDGHGDDQGRREEGDDLEAQGHRDLAKTKRGRPHEPRGQPQA